MEENEEFELTIKNVIRMAFNLIIFFMVLYAMMWIATI